MDYNKNTITLGRFLRLPEYAQKALLNRIIEIAQTIPEDQFQDVFQHPSKPGYYPVIVQYGKYISTRRRYVARWSGTHWGDCYDDCKTTGGRYSAWDVLRFAEVFL